MQKILHLLVLIFPICAYAQDGTEKTSESNEFLANLFFSAIALYIISSFIRLIWWYRCPKCKKWWVMRQEKKQLLSTDIETETKQEEIKDNNGKVLRVEEVKVPVLVQHYEIWRKCKHCNHRVITYEDTREEKYDRTMLNQ